MVSERALVVLAVHCKSEQRSQSLDTETHTVQEAADFTCLLARTRPDNPALLCLSGKACLVTTTVSMDSKPQFIH